MWISTRMAQLPKLSKQELKKNGVKYMGEELDLTIREAIPEDAAELLKMTRQIGRETEFLVMDEKGINLPEELLAIQLEDIYESPNNTLFVALLGEQIIGTASLK